MRAYLFNFFSWWYTYQAGYIFDRVFRLWAIALNQLNLIAMLQNLFTPLYQDTSFIGRFISFWIRLTWVFGGGLLLILLSIPLIFIWVLWLLLPLIACIQIIKYFIFLL